MGSFTQLEMERLDGVYTRSENGRELSCRYAKQETKVIAACVHNERRATCFCLVLLLLPWALRQQEKQPSFSLKKRKIKYYYD